MADIVRLYRLEHDTVGCVNKIVIATEKNQLYRIDTDLNTFEPSKVSWIIPVALFGVGNGQDLPAAHDLIAPGTDVFLVCSTGSTYSDGKWLELGQPPSSPGPGTTVIATETLSKKDCLRKVVEYGKLRDDYFRQVDEIKRRGEERIKEIEAESRQAIAAVHRPTLDQFL